MEYSIEHENRIRVSNVLQSGIYGIYIHKCIESNWYIKNSCQTKTRSNKTTKCPDKIATRLYGVFYIYTHRVGIGKSARKHTINDVPKPHPHRNDWLSALLEALYMSPLHPLPLAILYRPLCIYTFWHSVQLQRSIYKPIPEELR